MNYLLRNVPPGLWARAKSGAAFRRLKMRDVLLKGLERMVSEFERRQLAAEKEKGEIQMRKLIEIDTEHAGPYGEKFAGWYYNNQGNDMLGIEDVFEERWDSTTGPVQNDVIGPFKTPLEAARDRMQHVPDVTPEGAAAVLDAGSWANGEPLDEATEGWALRIIATNGHLG